jgi:methylglyoxal reductase
MAAGEVGAMKYRRFPKSGLQISALGFGAMGFAGWFGRMSDQDCIRALQTALERGVNFVDTARAYGESERILGEGLRQWRGDRPFIATKIEALGPKAQFGMPLPPEQAFPKGHITADCDRSLKALGLESVDLMQLHLYWPTWGDSGYWMDELQALKRQGKARYVGISIPDHRSEMVLPLVQSGLIDSVQTIVNIFDPLALETLVPICEQNNVAVIARCILDEGGLTGFLTEDMTFPEGDFRHGYFDLSVNRSWYIHKVDQLRRFVPQYASSLAALAIKFACHLPGVTTAITSMHVEDYARINIAALDEPDLPLEIFHRLRTSHRFIKNMNHSGHWEVA